MRDELCVMRGKQAMMVFCPSPSILIWFSSFLRFTVHGLHFTISLAQFLNPFGRADNIRQSYAKLVIHHDDFPSGHQLVIDQYL